MFECVAPGKMYGNIGLAPITMPHIHVKDFISKNKLVAFKMYKLETDLMHI
jgi:hypothetical protein